MNTANSRCNPSSIHRFFSNDLAEDSCERLEYHVTSCVTCQERLQKESAEKDLWVATKESLQDDAYDLEPLSDTYSKLEYFSGHLDIQTLLDSLAPSDDPRMLGRLDGFEIAGVVGSGGMGIVLKAFEPALARYVAVKVLNPELWRNEMARQRFSREARAAASVIHENVIEIYSVSTDSAIPYLTMPYLRGETLAQRIANRGPLGVEEVLRISRQLAAGVGAAHRQGLVHRDIKPANVFLSQGAERVRITDFGLAYAVSDDRLTQTGVVSGTPAFMSPEQIKGESLDQRSDLFSLGSVMYMMCASDQPFHGETVMHKLRMICDETPTKLERINPSIPTWLAAIVDRLHQKSPDDRYASADELVRDLDSCLANLQNPLSFSQPKTIHRLQARYVKSARAPRSNFMAPIAYGCLLILLATGVTAGLSPQLFSGLLLAEKSDQPIALSGRVVNHKGEPVAGATVLAVQKTWPNDQYRQAALKTTTNADGTFTFKGFGIQGEKYAFLLTSLADGYAMTSQYKVVSDGQPQPLIILSVTPCDPTRIRVVDADGNALPDVKVLPDSRKTAAGEEHMTYSMQVSDGKATDKEGQVTLYAFAAKDTASIYVEQQGNVTSHSIQVGEPVNTIKLEAIKAPISVQGRVVTTDGKPLAEAKVIVVKKTWPGGRFRMEPVLSKTSDSGEFILKDFVPGQLKHEFMVTIIEPGFAMTSLYRGMDDADQDAPMNLVVEPTEVITFTLSDADGKPLAEVLLSPTQRETVDGVSHHNYSINREAVSVTTNAAGEATMSAWNAGEKGTLLYNVDGKVGTIEFQVPESRQISLRIPKAN